MYEALSGEADLACMEPELSVRLQSEQLGHIRMEEEITPDNLTQQDTFEFEIDQTYLAELINECRR